MYFLAESPLETPPTHLPVRQNGFKHRKLDAGGVDQPGVVLFSHQRGRDYSLSIVLRIDQESIRPRYGLGNSPQTRQIGLQFWHPDALQSYVDHGLYAYAVPSFPVVMLPLSDLEEGSNWKAERQVLLKMPPVEEASTFTDVPTFYEVWQKMKDVDERIPIFWIMPKPETTARVDLSVVWRHRKNSSNVIINPDGHFVPQQAPEECTDAIMGFLRKQYYSAKSKL
ncbi:hypothetical protein BDN71DRAFT_1435706 [Pleurotus eryngii]|uniref:Uncharacterized protein n=1 Tax=Pleurotus eryngii TaxID=5323 RepID=A0A9P5ZJQ4_PLEER|nr:hypothetical protein BDN71DRAFT_1435706 [Pleurotus eryngii]